MREYPVAVFFFFKWNKTSKQLNGKTFKTLMNEERKMQNPLLEYTLLLGKNDIKIDFKNYCCMNA